MVAGLGAKEYLYFTPGYFPNPCHKGGWQDPQATPQIRSRNPHNPQRNITAPHSQPATRGSTTEPHRTRNPMSHARLSQNAHKCFARDRKLCLLCLSLKHRERPLHAGDEVSADSCGGSGDRSEIHRHSDSSARNPKPLNLDNLYPP